MQETLYTLFARKHTQDKSRRSIFALLLVPIIGSMWVLHSCAAAQPKKLDKGQVVIATTGRALERAVHILGDQLHCVINYSDPPYNYPPTIQFLTPIGPEVPAEQNLYFSYNPQSPTAEIIQNMIDAYHASDNSVIFKLTTHENEGKETYSVTPSQVKTKEGVFTPWESPLDKKISITATDTYLEIGNRIAALVSQATSQNIDAIADSAIYGRNAFGNEKVSFTAKNKSARSCLNSLIIHYNSKHKPSVIWSVLRGPGDKTASIKFQTNQLLNAGKKKKGKKQLSDTVSLFVESGRPLAKAVRFMERQSGDAILFEGSPDLCPCSVMSDRTGKAYSLRGGIFNFSYSSNTKFSSILTEGLKAFNLENVGEFVAKPVGSAFYVHPTVFMNAKGKTLPHKPLLEIPISLSTKGKSLDENLKSLCAALTAQTPYKVSLGELPSLPLFKQIATEDVTKQPAVDYLSRLSQKTGDKISWQLLYMPKTSEYVLNAHLIDQE